MTNHNRSRKQSEKPIELIKEIEGSIVNLEKEKPVNEGKVAGLEQLLSLINILRSGYLSSSQKLSWEKTTQSLLFLYICLISRTEDNSIEKINKAFLDKYYIKEFLDFIFDKKSWEEWDYYEIKKIIVILILLFLPNKIFDKIKLPINLLNKINIELMEEWAFQQCWAIQRKLGGLYKQIEPLGDIVAFSGMLNWIKNEKLIKSFTKKEKKMINYEQLDEVMKRNTAFWNIITDRENLKLTTNRKYTQEMFEFTSQKKLEGYKDYVAYRKTLEKFDLDALKDESYGKRYRSYLNKKK